MDESGLDLSSYLHSYPQIATTKHIVLERQLLARSGEILRAILPGQHWLLVADQTTWPLAGPSVAASAQQSGITTRPHIIESTEPTASNTAVAALHPHLAGTTALVAIGSGTVNDIAKMAAHQAGLPYAVVATAPSMNGYTSSIAALLVDGVKTTQPCTPPVACLGDLEMLAAAPHRMVAAGLGDLLSKPVSNADWLLAHALANGAHSTTAANLIAASADFIAGIAGQLPAPTAVGKLMASLCLSGLAMSVAGTSAPASGGEHLISHYLDMTHHAFGAPNDLHGCQVGVATLATAALYEKLLALDPQAIDVNDLVAHHPAWSDYEPIVRERFGPLAAAILPHARQGHPTRNALRTRLTRLRETWDELLAVLRPTLRSPEVIRAELLAARCPTTFTAIGIDAERARRAIAHSKDIRPRYTILHLATELGRLEEWTADLRHVI